LCKVCVLCVKIWSFWFCNGFLVCLCYRGFAVSFFLDYFSFLKLWLLFV
jgi:hypothetical protein